MNPFSSQYLSTSLVLQFLNLRLKRPERQRYLINQKQSLIDGILAIARVDGGSEKC
jgi:hypothetical protein